MSPILILKELSSFDDARRFVSFLEIKFLADQQILSRLKIAKKSLDKALTQLAFDLQKKLGTTLMPSKTALSQHQEPSSKSASDQISDHIFNASEQLKDFQDTDLNEALKNLILFTRNYKSCSILITQNPNDLKILKEKILSIIAERFS